MAITSLPTKTTLSLGEALTNTRTPEENEESAVHYERIKDRVIEAYTEIGLSDGSTAGSINAKLATIETNADVTDAANVAAAGAIMDSDFAGVDTGVLTRTGAGAYAVVKDKLDATIAPTSTDDATGGYTIGSRWINVSADSVYMCTDSAGGAAVWKQLDTSGVGSGDVVGPASSTDNAIARFDLATGKIIQNSDVTIDDSGNISTAGTVDGRDLSVDGAKLDGIEALADVTDAANVAAAGAVMTSRSVSTTAPLTGGGALSGDLTLAIPAATSMVDGYATAAQITKLEALAATSIETLAATSDTLAYEDNGKVIRCTAATTVTITVPSGLTSGVTVEYVQEGAGQVQLVGSALTLRHPSEFNPYTKAQYSSVVVTILDTDEALVRGHLAAV